MLTKGLAASSWIRTVFSVSACNTRVAPVTLRYLKGQVGVSEQNVAETRNFIIKPLIWLQGCPIEIENTGFVAMEWSKRFTKHSDAVDFYNKSDRETRKGAFPLS